MEYSVFESRMMELVFKTDQKLTPQLVAFRLGCQVDVARRHLEHMVTDEILSMEVDQNGVIHYDMVGRPPPTNEALSWIPATAAALATPQAMMPLASHVQQHGIAPVHIQINNAPTVAPTRVVVIGAEKSVTAAVLLSFFLGPLGMLYSTGLGAIVMFLVNLVIVPATLGAGLLLTIPAGMIWAGSAASAHNQRLRHPLLTA